MIAENAKPTRREWNDGIPIPRWVYVVIVVWLFTLVIALGVGHLWGRLDRQVQYEQAAATAWR